MSLLHVPSSSPPAFIEWVGLESPTSAAITSGSASTPGIHIVYIDGSKTVDIQVASADTIKIHNAAATTRAGNVTLVW